MSLLLIHEYLPPHTPQVIGDSKSEAGDSGDDCDSDSDYEDIIPEDIGYSKKKSEPTMAVTLSIGAFST